ncbi:glycosyltransferase family 8 protein [Avibacterium avium]|uniref:glycosyltransferase family 8 protein n=1 Tax=Avibacterium avium TaxID=751 RepID=UPI003BF88547
MNILLQSDNNYATHLLCLIKQIKNDDVNFYIFDLGISDKIKSKISSLSTDKINIQYIPINKQKFEMLPKTIDYISIATYARLKACEYLPKNIDKILYLDIDVIVSGSLKPLWDTDIEEYSIGACIDSYIEFKKPQYKRSISLEDEQFYFNAGVLLINLKKWRTLNVFNKAIEIAEKYKGTLYYQDQDILNIIFKNQVKYLDCRFNFMPTLVDRIKKKAVLNPLEKTTMPILISHFCGETKPWHKESKHINTHIYNLNLSDKGDIFIDRIKNIKNYIRKLRYKIRYHIY